MGAGATVRLPCPGDCDGDGRVVVAELIIGVRIALGDASAAACAAIDRDGDAAVGIADLVAATNSLLGGCRPPETATPPPTSPATAAPRSATPLRSATASPSPTPRRPTPTSPATTETATATPALDQPTVTASATVPPNRPPVIGPLAVYRSLAGYPISVSLPVADPDGDAVQCTPASLPDGAFWEPDASRLRWTPDATELGNWPLAFECHDDAVPPAVAHATLTVHVAAEHACTAALCDATRGCATLLRPLDEPCCAAPADAIVCEPVVECPDARTAQIGTNNGGFGALADCDRLRVINFLQSGGAVRFHVAARCLADGPVTVRARLTTASELHPLLVDSAQAVTLSDRGDGYMQRRGLTFPIQGGGPFFDLEGTEADFSVTLTDREGVEVRRTVRVVLTFATVADLPEEVERCIGSGAQ